MSTTIDLTLNFGYTNTNESRQYSFAGLSTGDLDQIEPKITAINESLAGGTDGGLADFFRAEDYDDSDPQNIIGKLEKIKTAKITTVQETVIFEGED